MEVVDIKKILMPNLLIHIYLRCVRSSLWCATTLATLVIMCLTWSDNLSLKKVLYCLGDPELVEICRHHIFIGGFSAHLWRLLQKCGHISYALKLSVEEMYCRISFHSKILFSNMVSDQAYKERKEKTMLHWSTLYFWKR